MSLSSLFTWGRREDSSVANANPAPEQEFVAARKHTSTGDEGVIDSGRYATLLHREHPAADPVTMIAAWEELEKKMALVPAGEMMGTASAHGEPSQYVPAIFVDRFTVTNADYYEFVVAGGYDQSDFWPQEVWAHLPQFVDTTGYSGPRGWSRGEPGKRLANHPVTGICWFEANAYALWVGKRLPGSAEWERAGTWASNLDESKIALKYPWGNSFAPDRANLWSSGEGATLPVDACPKGCTPNGIYQLVGNVWEWTADEYHGPAVREGLTVELEERLAEIRGGAFDTYFETQATCRFRSGKPFLFRGRNTGFRCVVTADDLRRPSEGSYSE